jgi:hypothetical protein
MMKKPVFILFLCLMGMSYPAVADWYRAIARPNLVVRDAPDVTAARVGTVPYGGKVDVVATVSGWESVGGRSGYWVKIHWQSGKAYVFDAFLEPLDSSTSGNGSSTRGEWFIANADPSLVVRKRPDVTASQIGSVPPGGKVKVLKAVSDYESVGGRTGRWVKIEWQNTVGYVFDAFLEPAN